MIYLDSDHSGLNKFSGEDDPNFKVVGSVIERMVHEVPRPGLRGILEDVSGNFIWVVPRIVNNLFTGRTETITKITDAIKKSNGAQQQHRFIIMGMGGQGKSEICLHIANKVRQEYVNLSFHVENSSI